MMIIRKAYMIISTRIYVEQTFPLSILTKHFLKTTVYPNMKGSAHDSFPALRSIRLRTVN